MSDHPISVEKDDDVSASEMENIPLIVDLDGTLTPTDTLHEALVKNIKTIPVLMARMPFWLLKGKAGFKSRLADHAQIDVSLLPYNDDVLAYIQNAKAQGRSIVLATASDHRVAQAVADHLGVFDDIIATSPEGNLSGAAKRDAIEARYGVKGFDYIGNESVDKPIWRSARRAILCHASSALIKSVKAQHEDVEVISKRGATLMPLIKAARPYQWVKNLLVFIPMFAAHYWSMEYLSMAFIAFLCFCAGASAVYLMNDIMDLENDRQHPRKKYRPFAAGQAPIITALVLSFALMAFAVIGAYMYKPAFALTVIVYLILTTAYSLILKRFVLIDVVLLASLYTLRLIAGGVATNVDLTLWLLGFSMFLFTSLAFAKRYVEVSEIVRLDKKRTHGRGYLAGDQNILLTFGAASGMAAVVMLALYVNNAGTMGLYANAELLWGICPVLLFWISYVWLAAQRNQLTDDPIIFALRDNISRVTITLVFLLAVLAL